MIDNLKERKKKFFFKNIFQNVNKRYEDRFKKFGDDPKTLGWDNLINQNVRFKTAYANTDFKNRKILDVGCGLGNYYEFLLKSLKKTQFTYTGIDINSSFIKLCKLKHENAEFFVKNILTDDIKKRTWNIVTMFGLLNLKIEGIDKYEFARDMINSAFDVSNDILIVDMLSTKFDKSYKKETFVNYFDPLKLMNIAFKLSPNVKLIHDYASIPQREFMLIIRKKTCKY
ncbi:MAG: methyltransferase type 11 [SAR116 cluster bacterium]|nr:methyltransferase type 11 [SAR116 cluster bacterium]RPH12328.1 MAG: class I SAM-dependent methyltransferase [Alphaproteobacteria bacterium TMED54]